MFRSHRQGRIVVTDDEPHLAAASSTPVTTTSVLSGSGTPLANSYAATFDGGEEELWQFYETLAEASLHVLLDDSTDNAMYEPKVFALKDHSYLLAFELPEQADELTGTNAATSPVLGMDVFKLLRGRDIGLGINMGGTSSATLISSETIEMICAFHDGTAGASQAPVTDTDPSQFRALLAPKNFPDTVHIALGKALAPLKSKFNKAILLQAEYENGRSGHIVAVSGALEADRGQIASMIEHTISSLRRSDIELDVAFLADGEAMASRIERIGAPIRTT